VDLHAAVAVSEGVAAGAPFPAPVVVPRWKWRIFVHPASWAIAFGMFAVIVVSIAVHVLAGAVAFGLFQRWFGDAALPPAGAVGTWTTSTWVIAGLSVAALGVSAIASSLWCIRRLLRIYVRAMMASIPETDPARSFKRAELSESGPPLDAWTKAQAARWLAAVRTGSEARMFASVPIADRAAQYDRTDRPVEPERVGGIAGSRDAGALLGCAAMAAIGFWRFGAAGPLIWAFGVVFVTILLRMVRRRTLFTPVVAGQGWIQHGEARWSVGDSVVLATGGRSRAQVCVVGPPGVMTMRLDARPGKDLEVLWMRWMHPYPNLSQQAFNA
jgi:hypothetical protein